MLFTVALFNIVVINREGIAEEIWWSSERKCDDIGKNLRKSRKTKEILSNLGKSRKS